MTITTPQSEVPDSSPPPWDRFAAEVVFPDLETWRRYSASAEPALAARWQIETSLPNALAGTTMTGYCAFCGTGSSFSLPSVELGCSTNLREELICGGCKLNARARAGFELLERGLERTARPAIYLTEQASFAFVRLRERYPETVGTEYFTGDEARVHLEGYLEALSGHPVAAQFGDITRLTFADDCFDAVVSFDVLEHVPDYRQALRELARVTRPGGFLVLTAPFLPGQQETRTLARVRPDGSIEHLHPPEYHGDPLSPEGVLCFQHFGWDLLEHVRTAGYSSASMALPWSVGSAVVGGCWTLLAVR